MCSTLKVLFKYVDCLRVIRDIKISNYHTIIFEDKYAKFVLYYKDRKNRW